jgi:hypothetical protein
MDVIDRSIIPHLHAAARRERAAYLSRLLGGLVSRVAGLFAPRIPRHARWA